MESMVHIWMIYLYIYIYAYLLYKSSKHGDGLQFSMLDYQRV